MPARSRKSRKHDVSHEVITKGASVLALGVGLLIGSLMLPANNAMLKPVAIGLRTFAPYAMFFGALICFVGWLLRPRSAPPAANPREPDWFPNDSTDFLRNPSSLMSPVDKPGLPGRRPPATTWCMQVFDDIEWRRFETLCSGLFAQAGFEARTQSHGADGGVDIWLHSRNAEGPVSVVQCKHWHGKQVGVKEMREFFGVMASRRMTRGTYATTSTFTEDARQFARENGIHLLDGQGLLALIGRRSPDEQQALLRHAYEGEYWRPTCASCGTKMVERSARKKGAAFWGCADYPRCRSTLPMRNG